MPTPQRDLSVITDAAHTPPNAAGMSPFPTPQQRGARLTQLRRAQGVSHVHRAMALGDHARHIRPVVTPAWPAAVEAGECSLSLEEAGHLTQALGVSLCTLLSCALECQQTAETMRVITPLEPETQAVLVRLIRRLQNLKGIIISA